METHNLPESSIPAKKERWHDIDWLRLIAVFLLFFFHTARVFSPGEEFYAHNDVTSNLLNNLLIEPLNPWHMPIFFLLAGASTFFALRHRSSGQYALERFRRLFTPFVFGVLVLIAPQSFLGLLSHSDYSGSYLEWYPDFFTLQADDEDGYFLGGHTWGHLWFIAHLFIYSLLTIPIFIFFKRETGKRFLGWLAYACTKPGVILLFPALLLLMFEGPDIAGGKPTLYITFFVFGYIIMSDSRFWGVIDKYRFVSILLGPVFIIAFVTLDAATWPQWIVGNWSIDVIVHYFHGFAPWFTILACLSWGRRLLNFTNGFLNYFAEGAYALYILHQTIIIIIGYFVIQTDMAVGFKYVTILTASFISTVLVYDLIIRRNNVVRFLFGMKAKVQ